MPLQQMPPQPPLERPLYVLSQTKARALVPKILSFLVLGSIFYVGILLNIALLELRPSEETTVQIIALVLILGLVVVGVYLAWRRAERKYIFYSNRMIFGKEEIYYAQMANTSPKKDLWDKIFKTYVINVGNHFHIRHIPEDINLQQYLQQLVAYTQQRQ